MQRFVNWFKNCFKKKSEAHYWMATYLVKTTNEKATYTKTYCHWFTTSPETKYPLKQAMEDFAKRKNNDPIFVNAVEITEDDYKEFYANKKKK